MRKVGYLLIISFIFYLFVSCNLSNQEDVAAHLRGIWIIIENPDNVSPHHSLKFLDSNEYQILDANGIIFERGPMTNVTENSFEYSIEQADHMPGIIGSHNYAEYTVTDDILDITFYDDSTKTTRYVTFIAQRQ